MKAEKGSIRENFILIIVFLIIIIGIGSKIFLNIQGYTNKQEMEIIVKDKYVKNGMVKVQVVSI